ncbi:MAG TPA: DUF5916 domain-containing protein [Ignavibacteriaceae bacterium]|nr:DUF5916 domain-containing protein [Ignavibacteriaceae bacterium]
MKTALLLFLAAAGEILALQSDTVRMPAAKVEAFRLTQTIKIDGLLNDEAWQNLPRINDFTQKEPTEGIKPTEMTSVMIAYDDNAIYIGARMYDSSPDSIMARLARKDVDAQSDIFGVFFDPYYDKRSGYYFALNAAGSYYDGVLYNDDWDDNTWDGVWEGKVNIDEKGWTAEMRIPFSQMRFQEKDNYVWGINFRRDICRKNERDYLVYIPKTESGFVSRFKDLVGINHIRRSGNLEILPYITTKAEYSLPDQNNPFNHGSKYTPGIGADLKYNLGSNLALNATINPDFGQVEIDPAIINLSDVETYFNEKRPFFVEGSTIFNFGFGGARNYWSFNWGNPNFFYSRRIGRVPQGSLPDNTDYTDVPLGTHIIGAAKLTGKIDGDWNVGAIQSVTSREFARIQTAGNKSRLEVEPLTYYGIVRAQKEMNEGKQAIGFISTVTVRDFNDNRLRDEINSGAYTFGIDGWTFLDSSKTWVVSGWTGMSHLTGNNQRMIDLQENSLHYFQRPDASYLNVDSTATSLTGFSGRINLNKQKGNFFFNSAVGFISPKFDVNDVGFFWQSDVINSHIGAGYSWTEPKDFYHYMEMGGALFRSYDFGGDIIWQGVFHFGYIQFANYYTANWSLAYNPETINNRKTRGGPLSKNPPGYEIDLSLGSDSRESWVLSTNGNTYQSKDQNWWNTGFTIEYKPSSNISVSINPFLEGNIQYAQYVDVFDDPYAVNTYGKRYLFAEMNQKTFGAGIRLNWTFTPKLSLQVYMQPLISCADYNHFKELAAPRTYSFDKFDISSEDNATTRIDPDKSGPASEFSFDNPDFSYKSLRGNAVLRWEYLPGSVVYFVWTQTRSDSEDMGIFRFNHSVDRLLDAHPDNIFIVKFTYWLNM